MRTNRFAIALMAVFGVSGCTLEEPLEFGERCDAVSFVWPDEAGGKLMPGDSETYDYYLNNRICAPDKPYCLMKKGFVHRGTVDENGEYLGDVVYPDEWYCSDRKESCPKDSHLVTDDVQRYCEQDSALHCGSVENNCMDSAKGVDAAQCEDGQCVVQKCMQGFTLINGECLSGAQCCGDYCKNCTMVSQAHLVCATEDLMNFDCGEACPLDNMIECYGVCINPDTNLAYCGTESSEDGNCEMHYCPDMDGWRNGSCTAGICLVSECILGYHMIADEDGIRSCEPDTIEVCGTKLADCNQVAHASEVSCERGLCIIKSCEDGYTLYDNQCIDYAGKTCEGVVCGPHAECDETTQLCKCESGYTDCNGECYDLQNSAYHCGSCTGICTSDKYSHSTELACIEGVCEVSACEDGYHVELGRCTSNTCTDGETDCIHSDKIGMVKTCEGGVWGEFVSCENVSCNNEIEQCGVCINGTKRCEDRMLLTCINGRWQNAVECDASLVCSENSCVSCGAEAHVFGNSCEKHDVSNCGTHDTKCDASARPNGTEFNCDTGTCKATKCASGYHVYGDGCEKDDVNNCNTHGTKCGTNVHAGGSAFNCECGTNVHAGGSAFNCNDGTCKATACASGYHKYGDTCEKNDLNNCNTHGTKCGTNVHAGGSAFNCNDGTCKATACASSHHKYGDTCEKNDVYNCGTHGKLCNSSVIANGSSFNCDTGSCKVTVCASGYHLNGNGCEKDSVTNCGSHGTKCDASVIANGASFNCDTGTCKVTSCSDGYPVKNNKCGLCNKNLVVYVSRPTTSDDGINVPGAAAIRVHYKRKAGNETDPSGNQRYKVFFSWLKSDKADNKPSQDYRNRWMYADYVNILTTVKKSVNVNDPPLDGVIPMPKDLLSRSISSITSSLISNATR